MQIVRRDPLTGYLDSMLWIPKSFVNVQGLKRALSPEFPGRGGASTVLQLWQETDNHLLVPREFWRYSEKLFEIVDCRPDNFETIEVTSRITLDAIQPEDTTQRDALNALIEARGGILQLRCGAGKTVIALELIARRKVPTIIIVDNTTLMGQWLEEIARHLDVPGGVGVIEGGKFDWQKPIVLATYQTLAKRSNRITEAFRRRFGIAVWDEGHHTGAPTFARTADMFYGRRYALTATPKRADGFHVIYDMHIGPVLYKNLKQDLKPRIEFLWSGFGVEEKDPYAIAATHSKTGELHLGKLAGYFGNHMPRLRFIIENIRQLRTEGRKVLVLSSSIDSLVNLLSVWNGFDSLFSEIPLPTPKEIDPQGDPTEEDWKKKVTLLDWKLTAEELVQYAKLIKRQDISGTEKSMLRILAYRHRVEKEMRRRQKAYIDKVLRVESDAGLMIYDVEREQRRIAIKEKPVTFSIMKYGREGLDSKALDTVIIVDPQAQQGWIQQVMGRALRLSPGKQQPLIIIVEDAVGTIIGMCNKLRKHLRSWPLEDGGPYGYMLTGNRPNGGYRG